MELRQNGRMIYSIIDTIFFAQIQAAFRTDEIRRTPPTPQDEMRAGMSYFHETIWKGVPKFLRRVDTALKNIGINERVPYNAPVIQFSSWMGGDRDGIFLFHNKETKEKNTYFLIQISYGIDLKYLCFKSLMLCVFFIHFHCILLTFIFNIRHCLLSSCLTKV